MLSRRMFLGQLSAVSMCSLGENVYTATVGQNFGGRPSVTGEPVLVSDRWESFGRVDLQRRDDSIVLQDGFILHETNWNNCAFSFSARAPKEVEEVQIWAGICCENRENRYMFALRGGNNNDVYLARYAANGQARFLGIAPLGFHPAPGEWYKLRAAVRAMRFQIYLNDEALPRINVADDTAIWREGKVALGGGWLPTEYRGIAIAALSQEETTAIDRIGTQVLQPRRTDRQRLRTEQSGLYQPVRIPELRQAREEFPLRGKWLFLPEQEAPPGAEFQGENLDDSQWHLMDVPNFWTPMLTWLHGETGFPELNGISAGKGVSDKLFEAEIERLNSYGFDWRQTRAAWYRHYLELPADIEGRRFELAFDAIAKTAEVWVNGTKVGSHVGMFGELKCDITHVVHPGKNAIAVHVIGRLKNDAPNRVMGVAVTVEVTAAMLNSLPHGMYREECAGIWQPVVLRVTRDIAVQDIFIQPRLDGMACEISIRNAAPVSREIVLAYTITPAAYGEVLYASDGQKSITVNPGESTVHLSTPPLQPKLWFPYAPNMYRLEVTLTGDGDVLDRYSVPFGFRTFRVEKGRLLLNDRPFWLRGANHFPHALRPNDGELARRFMKLAKEGNVVVTRSHTAPFSETWLTAADEAGMAVSFEGTWPWLMLEGEPPSEELLHAWKDEYLALLRKYRNHPSIIFWTVNNEMKFPMFDEKKPDLLRRKWEILSDMVKSMRRTDPTRPVVCDSSYCRRSVEQEYEGLIKPNGYDDGDIDDAHHYFGSYEPSFFHFFHGEFGKREAYPERPLISQEMSTGYPRNDDGHPARFYLFKHYTPQSLVGDEAHENRNPAVFLKRQALMTKELAEAIRRTNRQECSGVLHFAYLTWFRDVWNADTIQPFQTYYALKSALQPVLVSAELYGRHFYAGTHPRISVCVVNDDEDGRALPAGKLEWEVTSGGRAIAAGKIELSAVPYYSNAWTEFVLDLPASLPLPRVDAVLNLRITVGSQVWSRNSYDIVIATMSWALPDVKHAAALLNPSGNAPAQVQQLGIRSVRSFSDLAVDKVALVTDAEQLLGEPTFSDSLKRFVNAGGRAILFRPGAQLAARFPERVKGYRSLAGEIVSMRIPESPVFDGLAPLDLAWWEPGAGRSPERAEELTGLIATL